MTTPATKARAGDHVFHRPSHETWVVAYADAERDQLSACGWPESINVLSECDLVYSCTDAEHEAIVREWLERPHQRDSGSPDHRVSAVRRLYGAAFGLALLLALLGCEGEHIIACGNACLKTNQPMASWSKDGGCVCRPAPDGGAP